MPQFKDEHILLISPGSQKTLAQLGLPESFTPARLHIPTRMFPAEKPGEWEPMKYRERKAPKPPAAPETDGATDVAMTNADGVAAEEKKDEEEEILYEEDPTSEEGAVYPIVEGRIVDWPCLKGLLSHVHATLSPPFHTPVLLLAQSSWTVQDREELTSFFFEQFKIPAFTIMDTALAVSYAYATPNATVVDLGYGKCDITTVSDHIVNDLSKVSSIPGCGGEAMTQRLLSLLSAKGFTRDMCEQLKKTSICEVLPPGTELPVDVPQEEPAKNPAAAASTGATDSGEGNRDTAAAQGVAPLGPGVETEVGEADLEKDGKTAEDDEGVLDVANIVASGKTSEFLAKREKDKADKANKKREAQIEAAVQKQAKLPNSKKARAPFQYLERRPWEELQEPSKTATQPEPAQDTQKSMTEEETTAAQKQERREERRRNRTAYVRRDIDVGLERFEAASGGILERLADSIHRCILSVPEVNKRSELWDSIIICGNGSKMRGFKEALFATLQSRHLISPSSATIFTSELPSQFSTPVATGANTPQPQQHPPQHHHPSGVNPLLHAATTASLAVPGQQQQPHTPQHQQQQQQQQQQFLQQMQQRGYAHSSHAQTPTSIKMLKPPEYFPEWKEYGMEEAAFLGAQVAAKVLFVVDQGLSKGFMSRTEYNEMGPQGIHGSCM